jgi:hypothetical protein
MMAEAANAGSVAGQIKPPEYRKAVQLIRTIKAKKEKISSVNGEIGDVWGKVEGHRVHKKAGKFFAALDAMEEPERADVMRSFNGLADAAGWNEEEGDLVDGAENKVVHMRMPDAMDAARKHLGTDDGDAGAAGEGSEAAE